MTSFSLREIDPPAGLLPAILARVAHLEQRAARVRLAFYAGALALSLLLLVPALTYLGTELSVSGFYDYAALVVTGFSQSYWPDAVLALTNALPSFALLACTAVLVALAWSFARTRHTLRIAFAA